MPADLPTAIGEVVRELREAQGITARELGRRIGLHYDAIQRLENHPGKLGGYVMTLAAVAGALGLRGSELLALAEARVGAAWRRAA